MKAPTPEPGEHPADYIERVIKYLTVPHRRRMGEKTASNMRVAVAWLRKAKP